MLAMLTVVGTSPLTAQPGPEIAGPPAPRIVQRCQASDDPDEVVVCGQDHENSPYRIPRELRDTGEVRDENASFDAQTRDMEALERFSSQNIGHQGIAQHSRQVDCEWRAARQVAAGRRPDCGRRRRSGE